MPNFPQHIQNVINSNYSFNFGDYISKGFEVVKNNFGVYLGFILLYFLISFAVAMIPFFGSFASSLFFGPCLLAGFYLGTKKAFDNNNNLQVGDFFKGFEHWLQLLVAALIQMGIMMVVMIPFILAMIYFIFSSQANFLDPDMNPFQNFDVSTILSLGVAGFVFMLPLIYLSIAWAFSIPLIVFYKMEAWPALEASRKIISKQWWMFFFFGLVAGLIAMAGALALFVGLFFTVPAVMCMYYAIFDDVVGFPDESSNDIMNHFIDKV